MNRCKYWISWMAYLYMSRCYWWYSYNNPPYILYIYSVHNTIHNTPDTLKLKKKKIFESSHHTNQPKKIYIMERWKILFANEKFGIPSLLLVVVVRILTTCTSWYKSKAVTLLGCYFANVLGCDNIYLHPQYFVLKS